VPKKLKRYYGLGHLHYITCSCYHRWPLLCTARSRNCFVRVLADLRERYKFKLVGYVVMPEHFHLLISEPASGTPSTVMQVLKQVTSRRMRGRRVFRNPAQLRLWNDRQDGLPCFWQKRFYDFNVWSEKKKVEKLNYMHLNPVKRGLVSHPKDWRWSSFRFYASGESGHVPIDPV
jgi:putative transposase